jgi:hypothetical protein
MKPIILCILALLPAGIALADEAEDRAHTIALELVS